MMYSNSNMAPQKKKIDKQEIIETRPLDSYFTSKSQQQRDKSPVNITTLGQSPNIDTVNCKNREKVLNNLKNNNIIYELNDIKCKIENLTHDEMTEIFKIIKNNNEKYTTNKNGIFINLSTLRRLTIQELCNFLYFCENNDNIINMEDEERAKYKNDIN